MPDDRELEGLDPYDTLDAEAARIDEFASEFSDDDEAWEEPSGCVGWTRRDLLAHLGSTEEYHHACFENALGQFFERFLTQGVTDLHGFNAMGIEERARFMPSELLVEWRQTNARTRSLFRERGDDDMPTTVGAYPARWQAFHVASELATHADDFGVPITPDESGRRTSWRARFSRFALMESKPEVEARRSGWHDDRHREWS